MSKALRIGVAGVGTVGAGVLALLEENRQEIAQRTGRDIEVAAVAVRDPSKPRGVDLGAYPLVEDARALAQMPLDVVVELVGGAEGIARTLVESSLDAGKAVVTANKALIAHHGFALARRAEAHNVPLAFEAAVAGGIPVIKTLREGLSANRFTRVVGILNGTCNYILTTMAKTGRAFDDVLSEAQALGYAEADPSFDVDGVDTGHKLAILAGLAFGFAPVIEAVQIEGIRCISTSDIAFAAELGYAIRLLGIAMQTADGVVQRVYPAMVPLRSPLGAVDDVFNAVQIEGNYAGRLFLEGRGAGAGPTASSVVADIMDVARGNSVPPFIACASRLGSPRIAPLGGVQSRFYIRFCVQDRPGVLAAIATACKEANISVRSLIQHAPTPTEAVQIVLTTHLATESALAQALAFVREADYVIEQPTIIRMEEL